MILEKSTKLIPEMLEWADYVVTVCGHADDHCPALPPAVRKEHWPLTDPAKATGSETEVMTVFYESRNEIEQRMADLVERLQSEMRG